MSNAVRITLGVVLLLFAIVIWAGLDYRQKMDTDKQVSDSLNDIANGNVVDGSLHASHPQLLCFDPHDLYSAQYGGSKDVAGSTEQVATRLVEQDRCTFSSEKSGFEMDGDGREVFLTRHGVLALWAAK